MDDSAKIMDENEITPQSNYVFIYSDGTCWWEPRFEQSVTHCYLDITWFPFDDQTCNVTFESWKLNNSSLSLLVNESYSLFLDKFLPSDSWYLHGTYYTFIPFSKNLLSLHCSRNRL